MRPPIPINGHREEPAWWRSLPMTALLESIPEAVFLCGIDTRIVHMNCTAQELLGCSREDVVGRDAAELARMLAPQLDELPVPLSQLAVSRALRGEIVRSEWRTLHRPSDGCRIECMVSASPVRGRNGQVLGALLLMRDVTELRELQRRGALTERHNAIGQLAAGMAHDFNNLLTSIDQSATVLELKQASPPDERRTYLEIIHKAVRRGAEIMNRVREHIQDGHEERVETDPRQLLVEALELTRPMWEAIGNISVVKELRPVGTVRGNPADLRRVFTNLIINAVQAMPRGGALMLRTLQADARTRIEVADTGMGIPAEQQSKVFRPYFTTKPKGTGLGLSGSQRIVLAHGGRITFQSEVGQGTTFTVELPVVDESGHGNDRAQATRKGSELGTQPSAEHNPRAA